MSCGFSAGDVLAAERRSARRAGGASPKIVLIRVDLPAPLGPIDGHDLALGDLDRDAVEDVDLGHVAGDQVLGGEHGLATAAPLSRLRTARRPRGWPPPVRPRGRRRSRAWSVRTSCGSPSAITRPSRHHDRPRSEWFITTSMSCSMNRNGDARPRAQPLHVVEQAASEGRVDPGHRLVEEQEARLGHQRPGELEQLALAAGERAGVVVGELGQVEDLEQLDAPARAPPLALPRGAPGRKITLRSCSPG